MELLQKRTFQPQRSATRGQRFGRRRGSVLAVTALSIVVLLSCTALVVDYMTLSVDAGRLQRGCDAAALAGATQLKQTTSEDTNTTNAYNVALNVAQKNNITPSAITFSDRNTKVKVTASYNRSYFFAPIMGVRNGTVTRSAIAGVAGTSELSTADPQARVVPIGITQETYDAYKNDRSGYHDIQLIRQNKSIFGQDDAVLFDLRDVNAKSPAKMLDQLTGASDEISHLGDFETTLDASNSATSNKLEDGLQTLFDRSAAAPWNDSNSTGVRYGNILSGASPRSNPRVVNLIVTPSTSNPHNGTYDTEVKGFAPVYIESYYDQGSDSTYIRVRFLPPTEISDGSITPDSNASDAITGVRVTSLLG